MEMSSNREAHPFWCQLKRVAGGLPGHESWKSMNATQWTDALNNGDRIGIRTADPKLLLLSITGSKKEQGHDYQRRMQQYSKLMIEKMSDQDLGSPRKPAVEMSSEELCKYIERESRIGRSMRVRRQWDREERCQWPEVAFWIKTQVERLQEIIDGHQA